MKYELRDIERTAIKNFLEREGFAIKSDTKTSISFITGSVVDLTEYVISNSSKYGWHITVKNIGNTYGPFNKCTDLMSYIYINKSKEFKCV